MSPAQQLMGVAAIWVGLHLGLVGSPLRRVIAGRIGEAGCSRLFAALLHFHRALIGVRALPW